MRLFIIAFLLVVFGCARNREVSTQNADGFIGGNAEAKSLAFADGDASATRLSVNNAPAAAVERKLIKNGSIVFEVSDVAETTKKLLELTTAAGGYLSSESQNSYTGSPRYEQTIRIPADKLDEFISKVEGLARRVDQKNINTQDVTEEFIDVETRLKTKMELEARYRELLKQANKVDDILAIETQLGNVRSEIESMEGRLTYLKNQVAFSTLTVTYYTVVSGNHGFGYRFANSFGAGWSSLLDFIIGLFEAWPFVLMLGLGIWLFVRWRKGTRTKRAVDQ